MTKAEVCLWKYALRAGMMHGYTFKRQRPVIGFIADFMCQELNLIIEVDGITHQDEIVNKKDEHKENVLCEFGFHIIRFKDEEVLSNIASVKEVISNWIIERIITSSP
jgi:very-short-patch-repair endonuclease